MINNTKILWAIVGLLVLTSAFFAANYFYPGFLKSHLAGSYYGVFMDTGDLYFGKFSYFPRLALTDVYLLTRNSNSVQTPFSLSRLSDFFWKPADKIILNPQNIVWMAPLQDNSPVAEFIKNRLQQSTQSITQPTIQSTSTVK